MPQACVYVLASLISGVSAAALILASGPSYTEARSPQGAAYNVKWEQSTYNGRRASPSQVAYLNSVEDFCLWAPSQPTLSATRNTEHTLVAWCMKSAQGTRLIPDGTISGARLVTTPEYVQITGVGNLANINVPADGVASASGKSDGTHGLVFTRAYGQLEQIYDWTSFVSQERFCFRACRPSAAASTACPRIHDISGCLEDVLGNYDMGVFEDYIGDALEVPSASYQEVLAAPSYYSALPPTSCMAGGTIGNAQFARARRAIASMSGSTSSALVTSFSYLRSHRYSAPLTSSTASMSTDTAATIIYPSSPTSMTADTATTIAFPSSPTSTTTDTTTTIIPPSFPTSTSTATTFMNSSIPVSSTTATSTSPYSYGTYSHWHSHTHWRSHHHSSFWLSELSSTSSAWSPTSSTPSFTPTFSTSSSSDPASSGTSTSFATSTSTSTSTSAPTSPSTSSFPSSYGTSSSLSELPSSQPLSYQSSSTTTPTSPPTSSSMTSSTPSQSSYVLTFTTPLPSSSVQTTSPPTSSSTFPNSQTQLSSQCPPSSQIATNAGRVVPSTPLLPLMLTTLMSVLSSSVGVLVL